jgi:class 3 adenylate cyclase
MNDKNNRLVFFIITLLLLIVTFVPVVFIAESIEKTALASYERKVTRSYLQLQHELIRFRLDLVPRIHVENIVKKIEVDIGLKPVGKARPDFAPGSDPGIYGPETNEKILQLLKADYGIRPLYLLSVGADLYERFAWYGSGTEKLSSSLKNELDANVTLFFLGEKDLHPITGKPDAAARYADLWKKTVGPEDDRGDRFYFALRKAFSDLALCPEHQNVTYEFATDRFESRRLFMHSSSLRQGKKILGGYFIIFAGRDLPPGIILKNAMTSYAKSIRRSYKDFSEAKPGILTVDGLVPSELFGYASLFSKQQNLPEKICVSLDISEDYLALNRLRTGISLLKKFLVLLAFFFLLRFSLFGFPDTGSLKRKMLFTTCLIVLLPYLLLGYFAGALLERLEGLRVNESVSNIEQSLYELKNYYSDQKLQHLFRLFRTKVKIASLVNHDAKAISQINSFEVAEPEHYCNFFFYRNDGFSRKFSSDNINHVRSSRFFDRLAAKYLANLGFLNRNKPQARKDLEMSGYTDGFIGELKEGYLEHRTLTAEGYETRDLRKIDDHSKMVYYLIPNQPKADGKIRAMAFAEVANGNFNINNPDFFTSKIFSKQMPFADLKLAMGFKRMDEAVGRWWPRELNSSSELKQLLDFAALTNSSGFVSAEEESRVKISAWRSIPDDLNVYAAKIESIPDRRVHLAAGVLPVLLILFTLISIFLFTDILTSLFADPVKIFAEGARKIRDEKYQTRILIENSDEFATLAQSFNRMAMGLQQRERMRRFVSEDLYQSVRKNAEAISETGLESKNLTVLASDIRDFTSLSEKYDAETLVLLLNDYFTEMEGAITSNGGKIVRFVGDAVIAVFSENDSCEAAFKAVKAGIAMRRALAELNENRKSANLFAVENGIGISSGEALTGVAGSQMGRKVFSVFGQVVALAETLEAMTKKSANWRIVVDEATAMLAEKDFNFVKITHEDIVGFDLVGDRHE